MPPLQWNQINAVPPRTYVCSYCDHTVGPDKGWSSPDTHNVPIPTGGARPEQNALIYICSFCGRPTFFEYVAADKEYVQHPGASFGNAVESLPDDVKNLYSEARSAMKVNAYTSAVLTCRKLLMHLAAAKGAPEGLKFIQYVEYLAQKGYVPPDGQGWVDHIRQKGNEANHEIKIMSPDDAKDLLKFTEMLLKFVYEFPAKVAGKANQGSASATVKP